MASPLHDDMNTGNTFPNCWCYKGLGKYAFHNFYKKEQCFAKFHDMSSNIGFSGKPDTLVKGTRIRIRIKMSGIRNPALNIPC